MAYASSSEVRSFCRRLQGRAPDMKGFSPRNIKYVRAFAEA
jgi:hypothetical protein